MTRIVEAIYEKNVLKPVEPTEGIKEHERVNSNSLLASRELVGTLTCEEAEVMQKLIDEEFEKIEGKW